jgi:hypothetical protein
MDPYRTQFNLLHALAGSGFLISFMGGSTFPCGFQASSNYRQQTILRLSKANTFREEESPLLHENVETNPLSLAVQ